MLDHLITVQEHVKDLLEKMEHLRDDDNKLVCNVWHRELKRMGCPSDTITAKSFMEAYIEGKIPRADIITRARRKIQEACPELRGKRWQERQDHSSQFK